VADDVRTLLIAVGGTIVAAGVLDVPLAVPYAGWALGSVGMGIVFPTIPLSVMSEATEGKETAELSSTILMDYLGIRIGAGLGGVCIALAGRRDDLARGGPGGAFGLGVTFALVLALVGRRLPDSRAMPGAVAPQAEDRRNPPSAPQA
jgi:hypothetical protein